MDKPTPGGRGRLHRAAQWFNPTHLHFNAASLHEFGIRYFNEYEKQKDPNKQFFEKTEQDLAVRTAMEQL